MKPKKLYERLRSGALANVSFKYFVKLLEAFEFKLDRCRGDHFIYIHWDCPDDMNVQPVDGDAKPYQIKQFLAGVKSIQSPYAGLTHDGLPHQRIFQ